MKQLIIESIHKGISYAEYKDAITKEINANNDLENNNLLNYSILNNKRIKRLDKTLKVLPEIASSVKNLNKKNTWLVLTESWCGDAAQILPVINKLAEENNNIDLKILYRDQNETLMNHFLTNGSKSIPKLIMVDNENHTVLNSWGPRPEIPTTMIDNYKKENGVADETIKKDIQVWYNKDKGINTQKEITQLLKAI